MRQKSVSVKEPAAQVVKDIRRATRRQFSAEDKIRIVLEGLRGEDSLAELCRLSSISSSVAAADPTDRALMRSRIDAKLRAETPDLRLPLRLRQLGAEIGHLGQERCGRQGRIGAEGAALMLLLQGCLAFLVGLQRTKGPNGAIAQSVSSEAV